MQINEIDVRQGANTEVTIGTVSEFNIRIKECVRKCNIDGEDTDVKSSWIGGQLVVKVNGKDIKHSFTYLDTIRHKKNGDLNDKYTGILTLLGYKAEFDSNKGGLTFEKIDRGVNPLVEGKITWVDANNNKLNEEIVSHNKDVIPTRVKVTSKLAVNMSLNKNRDNLVAYNDLPISYITTNNVDEEDSALFTIEGCVKEIVNEKNSSGTDTGRYLVNLVAFDFFEASVLQFVIEPKWVNVIDGEEVEVTKEDFYVADGDENNFCNAGDTVKLSGSIESHSFGSVQHESTAKRTFGGGAKNVRSGYEKVEWTIKSGDIVDGEDVYDTELVKLALEEREVKLDNEYKRQLEQTATRDTQASAKPKNTTVKANPFGNPTSTAKANPFAKKPNPFG